MVSTTLSAASKPTSASPPDGSGATSTIESRRLACSLVASAKPTAPAPEATCNTQERRSVRQDLGAHAHTDATGRHAPPSAWPTKVNDATPSASAAAMTAAAKAGMVLASLASLLSPHPGRSTRRHRKWLVMAGLTVVYHSPRHDEKPCTNMSTGPSGFPMSSTASSASVAAAIVRKHSDQA